MEPAELVGIAARRSCGHVAPSCDRAGTLSDPAVHDIVLHDYWRSSTAYRVRIALALKGVAYSRVAVNLLGDEQRGAANRAVNPQGLVPTLIVDGVPMIQSLAIIDWLDATCPDPPLLSRDAFVRQRQLARALVIATDIHPVNNMRIQQRLATDYGADAPAKARWARAWTADGLAALEAMGGEEGGPFLGGAAPDVADVCLVPQLYNARRIDLPLDGYPRLLAAGAAASGLSAFRDAHPDMFAPA